MRRRILRFLAEQCGFTVLAFEYGFSEGFPLDAWAQGEGTNDGLSAHLAEAIPVGVDEPLRWMRRHNATARADQRSYYAASRPPATPTTASAPWPACTQATA
ncbi:erythromycin esterase family protein [Nonomuraea angiospora]|uniref:erythromycin esterase family protein n=1 Tax=Nonomuraea angiospora TaxID=46172 RepID=UPI00341CE347